MRDLSIKAPVPRFHSTAESATLEQHFKQSFILDDIDLWGPDRIGSGLKKIVQHHSWVVRVLDDYRYLIKAPSSNWLELTTAKGFLCLENKDILIAPWDPGYSEGLKLIFVWIRVRGFPMFLWQWSEFERLFANYGGVLLETNTSTRNLTDWHFAKLRVGLYDPMELPKSIWMTYCDTSGYISRYDVSFEIEKDIEKAWIPVNTKGTGADSGTRPSSDVGFGKGKDGGPTGQPSTSVGSASKPAGGSSGKGKQIADSNLMDLVTGIADPESPVDDLEKQRSPPQQGDSTTWVDEDGMTYGLIPNVTWDKQLD